MTRSGEFSVRLADWREGEPALRAVRHTVFVVEQRVPEALEWDAMDARSIHALARDPDGAPIGCGRLLPTGYIGRMAVLALWRRRGVGAALLLALVDLARERGHARATLNAQAQAMAFYARHGFMATGEQFDEAGIDHRVMARELREPRVN
ncbi:MAG: GNAT family N-acetyltransferase [Casimicrobiaceae bacterium]